MSNPLTCPECAPNQTSLDLLVVDAIQQNAVYEESDDGSRKVVQAGSVRVLDQDDDELRCTGCGAHLSADDLVPAEVIE